MTKYELSEIYNMLQEEEAYYDDMMRITLEAMNSHESYSYDINEDDLPF